ncbi:spore germination protein [Paenibacillus sp. y28]|uniref:spore germination protein n=1 Tax=Paenibacillus sp. y28 TaxID=3129110 RepID=UPI00301649EF
MGLFGLCTGFVVIVAHLCNIRSFGAPFLAPLSPLSLQGLKDFWLRAPWWLMVRRPKYTGVTDPVREDPTVWKSRLFKRKK